MNPHEKALQGIFDDMDDMESRKMFGDPKSPQGNGFSVVITMNPNESHREEEKEEGVGNDSGMEDLPANMHMGGTVPKPELEADNFSGYKSGDPEYKKGEMGMAMGGMAPSAPMSEDDMALPPFLRKKKK